MTRGAVVLAAGRSDRMGQPKALLPALSLSKGPPLSLPKGFLRTILDTLQAAGVTQTRVVLGHAAEAIRAAEALPAEMVVVNADYASGMLSSVRCGVRALPPDVEAFLLWPVDHPLVAAPTVERLYVEAEATGRAIVVPARRGMRGHPALFTARMREALLNAPDDEGARAVLRTHPDAVLEIDVTDAGVVTDIDTPEAYAAAFGSPLPKP